MQWIDSLKDRFSIAKKHQVRAWDEEGLHAVEGETHVDLLWREVCQVHVYKKDCFAVDQIRVMLLGEHNGIEFTENDVDFAGLCSVMSKKLPIPDDWLMNLVRVSAFETSFTTLYDMNRTASSDSSA